MKDIEIVINPYSSLSPKNRRGIFVTQENKNEIKRYSKSENITALYVNCARGWKGDDFSFLEGLDMIEQLSIINSKCCNIGSIESMTNLQELDITASITEEINFSIFQNLSKCYLYWWKGAESIFRCQSIKSMYLDGVPDLTSNEYYLSENIQKLTIANSKIESLGFLSGMKLDLLALHNCKKIRDFNTIGDLKSLLQLEIRGCKNLESIDFVKNLNSLEVVLLSDNGLLDSLKYFNETLSLKALAFSGNTVIEDGNLSPLINLPNLSMLMFKARKHYSHKSTKTWNWNNFNSPDTLLDKK